MNETIHPSAVIGKCCNISESAIIESDCRVGDNVRVAMNTLLCPGAVVEDNVYIGYNVVLLDDDHMKGAHEPPTIKKGARIGHGSVICQGVTIGEKALVGVGSLVNCDVPAGEMWFGRPARRIRRVPKDEMK